MAELFCDENLESVEFKSTWKKERSTKDSEMVTDELKVKDKGVQLVKTSAQEVQTEDEIQEDIQLYEDDSPELEKFLLRMEPLVYKELQKNKRSHAFDGYKVAWEEKTSAVTCLFTLEHKDRALQLPVTGVSWNSTGSVLAVSYGRFDHEDWCVHKSTLCTWNIDRRNVDPSKADIVIDVSSCLMCVAYHPTLPSLIAGGTFSGEVMVWDLSRENDLLLASSGIGNDSHREPVSKMQWIPSTESQGSKYNLVTVGSDGRILIWQLHQHKGLLKLIDGFALLTESLPRAIRQRAGNNRQMGVNSVAFRADDETSFLVGSESGGLFRCSTSTRGTLAPGDIECSVPLRSPVNFSFSAHDGPVHSVECSPYHRNLFVSCSADSTIRIYSMLEVEPMVTLEPNAGYLYSATWSPVRPAVLAAVTGNGQLIVYDLKKTRTNPVLQLAVSPSKSPAYTLQFNTRQVSLLATGNGAGQVMIWKLNDDLTQQSEQEKEQELLDEIASSVRY